MPMSSYGSTASPIRHLDFGCVTMSIGVSSIYTNRPVHADQLVAMADAALYRAKDQGRDRIVKADEPANAPVREKIPA